MTKHVPKYTSIDLTYDILGKAAFVDDISVVIVNTVVTPSETLAGVALRLSQNDTQLSRKRERDSDELRARQNLISPTPRHN